MADDGREWRQETVRVGETDLMLVKGGKGKPLLILHEELGYPGWMKWNSSLARERTLMIPMHPGFGATAPPEWIRSARDLAGFYSLFVREQKLAPLDVIGFCFGGWVAAEM